MDDTSRGMLSITNADHANISAFLHKKDSNSSRNSVSNDGSTCTVLVGSSSLSGIETSCLPSLLEFFHSEGQVCQPARLAIVAFGPKP